VFLAERVRLASFARARECEPNGYGSRTVLFGSYTILDAFVGDAVRPNYPRLLDRYGSRRYPFCFNDGSIWLQSMRALVAIDLTGLIVELR
jgi:hypothetical protein